MGRKGKKKHRQRVAPPRIAGPRTPQRNKQHVLVGVLSGGGMVCVSIAHWLFQLPYLTHDPSHPFTYEFWPQELTRPQEYARNLICARFLHSKADIMLQIDDDMIPMPTTHHVLETPDYDIAAPIQFMWQPPDPDKGRQVPQTLVCAFRNAAPKNGVPQIEPLLPMPGVEHQEVDKVGSGCIAIRRHVVEDERMLLEPGLNPPALWRNVYRANGQRTSGLDTDFCQRAKDLGYRIKVNWRAEIGHFKRINLNEAEVYAKWAFTQGYAKGQRGRNELQVEGREGRQEAGPRGVARPGVESDAAVG